MAFIKCQHPKGRIDAAGEALITLRVDDPERDAHLEVIGNWRSCHGYPLHILAKNLQGRAGNIDERALVARRNKRLQSIAIKLRHNSAMKLSQMQDIGGCRAVLKSVSQVEQLASIYQEAAAKHKSREDRSFMHKVYDYIGQPKGDGYRGVHLIMKYQSQTASKKAYNGQRIEIQIRSRLQHAWATAIETCQTFTGQALKTKVKTASDAWIRFFALMSSAIAAREKRPIVPGTPDQKADRKEELKRLESENQIITQLAGWGRAMSHEKVKDDPECAAFLLELNAQERTLKITTFKLAELPTAHRLYLVREKATESDLNVQVVLVSADSVVNLRRAYPNFYVDTAEFIAAVTEEIY